MVTRASRTCVVRSQEPGKAVEWAIESSDEAVEEEERQGQESAEAAEDTEDTRSTAASDHSSSATVTCGCFGRVKVACSKLRDFFERSSRR